MVSKGVFHVFFHLLPQICKGAVRQAAVQATSAVQTVRLEQVLVSDGGTPEAALAVLG